MKKNFLFLSMLLACSFTGFAQTAFNGPHTVPCIVEAEDFDEGGEGVAYHDSDANNSGTSAYREGEGVDLQISGDRVVVDWAIEDEWLKYTVDVPETGNYGFVFTYGTNRTSGATITVEIDGEINGTYLLPWTESNSSFRDMEHFTTELQAGTHVVKMTIIAGSFYFDKFEIKVPEQVVIGIPYNGPHNVPCVIQAEDFDEGGQNVGYYDQEGLQDGKTNEYRPENTDVEIESDGKSEGYHVTSMKAGEWLNYTVNVATAGNYDFIFTWASADNGIKNFGIKINGVSTGTYLAIRTGTDDLYRNFVIEDIEIPAGDNLITITFLDNLDCRFDKFEIKKYIGDPYIDYEGSNGEAQKIPGVVDVRYFDNGGQDVAYHTSIPEAGGANNTIRQTELLPIGYNADWSLDHLTLKNRDWVIYTLDVEEQGQNDWYLQYSSTGEGTLHLLINDLSVGDIAVEATGAEEFTQAFIGGVISAEGRSYVKFLYVGEGELKFGDLFIGFSLEYYLGTPYPEPHIIPCVVQAEDYDDGGEGISYHDSPGHSGDAYRPAPYNDVDTENNAAAANGIQVAWMDKGEWLNWTLEAPEEGDYAFSIDYGIGDYEILTFLINGVEIGTYRITGWGNTWVFKGILKEELSNVHLQAGRNIMTLSIGKGGGNFDQFEVKPSDTGIKVPASLAGSVYAADGNLYLKGFSGNVSLDIYNLVGQKVAGHEAVSGIVPVSLAKGVYIVKVTEKGKSVSYKVIIN